MSVVIEIDNVSFSYGRQAILRDMSFAAEPGEFIAVAGPNGAGKSTLLNLLCGLLRPRRGRVRIDGKDIRRYSARNLARRVAMVRQESFCAFDFTVLQVVAMARTAYMSALGFESQSDREIIAEAMELTDTTRFASRPIGQLSGGERQRVFIARALAQQSPILVLDEPTTFLDYKHQVAIYDLLREAMARTNKTVVAATHDINLAMQYCDKAVLMSGGNYQVGDIKELFVREQIEQAFGVKAIEGAVEEGKFFMPVGKFSRAGKNLSGGTEPPHHNDP